MTVHVHDATCLRHGDGGSTWYGCDYPQQIDPTKFRDDTQSKLVRRSQEVTKTEALAALEAADGVDWLSVTEDAIESFGIDGTTYIIIEEGEST